VLVSFLDVQAAPPADAKGIAIKLASGTDGGTMVVVHGLGASALEDLAKAKFKEQWTDLFAVYVDSKGDDRPAMLGSYHIRSTELVFEPRFPLRPGLRYRAVFHPSRLPGTVAESKQQAVIADLMLPPLPELPATTVRSVYPSARRLPENLLKFYLHFSAPMSRGEAYRRLHLLDADGKEIALPFLELGEELWDPAGKRFTLYFDPGRIKRGLKPREEVGPALVEGKNYTLVIDRDWVDARGKPLAQSFRKSFRVGQPEEQPLDPKTWKMDVPPALSNRPLVLRFTKPLDQALLNETLAVVDSNNQPVAGTITINDEEKCWQFKPKDRWQEGAYQLTVATRLEDLAGNSIGRPFEIDVLHPIGSRFKEQTVKLPFEIKASR
jgi:hypothetical protein